MNDNIHDQNATLADIIHFAKEAKSIAEDLREDAVRPELLEAKNEEYRENLQQLLLLLEEVKNFDAVAL